MERDPLNDSKQLKLAYSAIYIHRDDLVEEILNNVKKIRQGKDEDIASGKKSALSLLELYQFALKYEDINNYYKSLDFYEEILKHIVNDTELRYDQDIRFYTPSVRAELYIKTGEIYLILEDQDRARIAVNKALEIAPDYSLKKAKNIISQLNN